MKYVYLLYIYHPKHYDYKNGLIIDGHYSNRPLVFSTKKMAIVYKKHYKLASYIRWVKLREN